MKRILGILLSFVFVFALSVAVFAQSEDTTIPEKNGDYAVPGRPNLRVRVFVHEPREKPTPSSAAICEDNPSSAVVGATGWKLGSNVSYKVNQSSLPSSIASMNLANVASTSFGKWIGSINPASSRPNLSYAGLTPKTKKALDFENIITWGKTQGDALGVTYVWYYTATKLVADVDTIMNQRFSWSLACSPDSYNAEDILVHELGHWFGLNDHKTASYVDNTMYGYGSKAEIKKITLEAGDKAGIDLIY